MITSVKVLSVFLISVGVFFLLSAALPILQYELVSKRGFRQEKFLSPLDTSPQAVSGFKTEEPYPVNLRFAKNWFSGTPRLTTVDSKITHYNLSVPKLKIENATATVGGEDLSESLIHYKGTGLPGKPGNTVIFGHSTLPQLFNPKNYLTIFSTLPQIKKDDKVFVDYDGIKYTYQVEEIFEVSPKQVEVLEQQYDDSYLTLITCVPPGTYLKRLVVKSRLVPPDNNF